MDENNHILEVKNLRVSYHTYAGEVKAVRGYPLIWSEARLLPL